MASDECDEPEIAADESLFYQDNETVCNICKAEFLDPQDLHLHLKQIHKALIYCKFCSASVTDCLEYAYHVRNEHLKSMKCCLYCSKIFLDYDQHRKHERRHFCAKKNMHACSQCPRIFEDTFELERHEYERHNNEQDGFSMQDFFPMLSSILNMKAVNFIQAMNAGLSCHCLQCGFTTSNVEIYIDHLKKRKCTSYSCDNCSSCYKVKRDIIRHLRRHKECFNFVSQDQTRKCPECLENILSRFYYNHTKQCNPIKCGPCNIVFGDVEKLAEHQGKQHPVSLEVKFCKFCNRQCVGGYSLERHMLRVHKREFHLYKYKCVECNTPFKHPQKLFAHYYNKHKSLEPYTCKICDIKFRIRRRFTIHIKVDHKSVGFVEFDDKYRVFFNDKKSNDPFVPQCVLSEDELQIFKSNDLKNKKVHVKTNTKGETGEITGIDTSNQTENEADTEKETVKGKNQKGVKRRRRLSKQNNIPIPKTQDVILLESSDDEDVPLVKLKKRKPRQEKTPFQALWDTKNKSMKNNRQQLTCKICKRYCYTYQNFLHHMSLHRKNDAKVCIKCSKDFKSKKELNKHIETEHSSSKLTETLKTLLEKRKRSSGVVNTDTTMTDRFQQTVKRSAIDVVTPSATVTQLTNGLSVKKYLETFTPESDTHKPIPNVLIEDSISIRTIHDPVIRKPVIKMTKFEPKPIEEVPKLKMPVKFKPVQAEPIDIQVKLIQNNYVNELFDDDQANLGDRGDSIPEVAQEVLLEGSEEPSRFQFSSKIPQFPEGTDISIAHLQSKAPYYKIVKVNELQSEPDRTEEVISKELIRLPDGTRLITVNPLAHLLGDRNVEDIVPKSKNKTYKTKDVEDLLTKALEKAKKPNVLWKKNRNAKNISGTSTPN